MNTITKEWLQQKIADMETARDDIPFGLSDDGDKTLVALRIAMASLEAEPVAINDDMAYAFHHALSDSSLGADEVEEIKTGLRAAFANVTTPPAPVSVPDEIRLLQSEVTIWKDRWELLRELFLEVADALGCDVKDHGAMLDKIEMLQGKGEVSDGN